MSEQVTLFARKFSVSAIFWRAAILRALLYMAVPLVLGFIAAGNGLPKRDGIPDYEVWRSMWWMPKAMFWLEIFANASTTLLAFLDKTVSTLKAEKDSEKAPSITEVFSK